MPRIPLKQRIDARCEVIVERGLFTVRDSVRACTVDHGKQSLFIGGDTSGEGVWSGGGLSGWKDCGLQTGSGVPRGCVGIPLPWTPLPATSMHLT